MNKISNTIFAIFFLLFSSLIYAQSSSMEKAGNLLNKYLEVSQFEENEQFQISDENSKEFLKLFHKNAMVIFDIPLANESGIKSRNKRYVGPERGQSTVISAYGKELSPVKYLEILKRETESAKFIKIHASRTTKVDSSQIDTTGIVVFEIEKTFAEDTLITKGKRYLVEIEVTSNNAVITAIRENKEDVLKQNVVIQLFSDSRPVKREIIYCRVELSFDEKINNTIDTLESKNGRIRLEQVANRATIRLLSAYNREELDYVVPAEWKDIGKKVSEKPEDGFEINLLLKLWDGITYSFDLIGGVVRQSENNTTNFSSDSKFTNQLGYKFGGEFQVSKYFNPNKWKKRGWLLGIGSGLSITYQSAAITSDNFVQNKYNYIDVSGDTCQVQFSGTAYKETFSRFDIAVPLFLDFKKRLSKTVSITFQPGINAIFPIYIKYNAKANFSRWGFYPDFNEQPITNDPIYNYYTDTDNVYKDESDYSIELEGQLRINFLLHVFNKHPDNALVIGLVGSIPITAPPIPDTDSGIIQEYNNYWMNTENDDYHSLAESKKDPYKFFIGISIGINLIRYRTR